ncbi:MAG: enoyl-CoA hydratase-related protein [Pusillimonas sp.]
MIDYDVTPEGAAVLTWNMTDRPVNVMNDESLKLFAELIEHAITDSTVKGIVIASAKRDFVTGADLVSFLGDRTPHIIFEKARFTQSILRRLETGGKPVCAALAGSALGGGMEIALACHHRIVADKPTLRLGLPEVTLGLLPGAGGTQRLPRLIGVRAALPFLLEGRLVTATEALDIGMVHEVVAETDLLPKAITWVTSQATPVAQPWDTKGFTLPGGTLGPVEVYQVFATETARITARTHNNLPAPRHILSAIYEGHNSDLDTGLKSELRHFVSCACSVESKNILRTNFFGVSDAAKLKGRPAHEKELKVELLGVTGNSETVKAFIDVAVAARLPVKWHGSPHTTLPPEWADYVTLAETREDLQQCSYIINGDESNTLTDLVPQAFLWSHANQASDGRAHLRLAGPGRRLIEIIRSNTTTNSQIAFAMDLSRRLRKVPIVIQAGQNTYIERVGNAYSETVRQLVNDGISPVLINSAAKQIGMDSQPLPESESARQISRTTPNEWQRATDTVAWIKDVLLTAQAEEALRCLDDGTVSTPLDADIAAVLGLGYPLHLGGPIGYIDTIGAGKFMDTRASLKRDAPITPNIEQILRKHAESSLSFHGD